MSTATHPIINSHPAEIKLPDVCFCSQLLIGVWFISCLSGANIDESPWDKHLVHENHVSCKCCASSIYIAIFTDYWIDLPNPTVQKRLLKATFLPLFWFLLYHLHCCLRVSNGAWPYNIMFWIILIRIQRDLCLLLQRVSFILINILWALSFVDPTQSCWMQCVSSVLLYHVLHGVFLLMRFSICQIQEWMYSHEWEVIHPFFVCSIAEIRCIFCSEWTFFAN